MTAKRDLKRRIRARQARTKESYTTARRHVLAARDSDVETTGDAEATSDDPTTSPIDVAEVIDVSDLAGELGFACNIVVYPSLTELVDPARALSAVSAAVLATPTASTLRDLALRGIAPTSYRITRDPQFLARARAGVTATSADGRVLAVHVQGHTQMVIVLAAVWRTAKTIMLIPFDDAMTRLVAAPGTELFPTNEPVVFLIFNGRRHRITTEPFVIGRHPSSNLQIRDGHVSRKHAAVMWRRTAFYIIDLGSHAGIEYRGLRVDNKRIEEGDLFRIGEYAVRFTFLETDG
jgi:hypothetical protein